MSDVYLKLSYNLEVSDKDMRLICLSLAGRIKTKDDKDAATELNVRLLEAQKIRLNEKTALIDGAIKRATEIQDPQVTLIQEAEEHAGEGNPDDASLEIERYFRGVRTDDLDKRAFTIARIVKGMQGHPGPILPRE